MSNSNNNEKFFPLNENNNATKAMSFREAQKRANNAANKIAEAAKAEAAKAKSFNRPINNNRSNGNIMSKGGKHKKHTRKHNQVRKRKHTRKH